MHDTLENILNDLTFMVTHYHPTEDKRIPHAGLLLSSDSQPSSPFPLTSRRSFVLLAFVSPTYLISNSQTSAKCLYSSCIQIKYHTTKIKTFLFDVKQCTLYCITFFFFSPLLQVSDVVLQTLHLLNSVELICNYSILVSQNFVFLYKAYENL